MFVQTGQVRSIHVSVLGQYSNRETLLTLRSRFDACTAIEIIKSIDMNVEGIGRCISLNDRDITVDLSEVDHPVDVVSKIFRFLSQGNYFPSDQDRAFQNGITVTSNGREGLHIIQKAVDDFGDNHGDENPVSIDYQASREEQLGDGFHASIVVSENGCHSMTMLKKFKIIQTVSSHPPFCP